MMSMINKRITFRCQVKMSRAVKPVRVSPTIKAARWALLFYGILHGSWKLERLRKFEETESVIRHHQLEEKLKRQKLEEMRTTIAEVTDLAKEFEVTEMPKDWEKEL